MTITRRKPRREKFDGREYLVASITLMVPGVVVDNSESPSLFEIDGIDADTWNGMPLLLNHPSKYYGEWVSGRTPQIIERYGLGFVFNAHVTDRLIAEGWFDVIKTQRIAPRIYRAIERGKRREVSMSLTVGFENTTGVHNATGKPYRRIARTYTPDHVAVLTNGRGVFSIRDGCGVNA